MWFTSDTHFFHRNVIDFCNRPWANVEEMNEGLIERWNARVGKRDHIYVLGDFLFGGTGRAERIVPRLNGYKIIVRGNHDPKARKLLAWGFNEVLENEALRVGDMSVYLSHFPWHPVVNYARYAPDSGVVVGLDRDEDTRYLHKRILDDGRSWLLHGHVHTAWKWRPAERMINVGCDVWDWAPVHHETLVAAMKRGTV